MRLALGTLLVTLLSASFLPAQCVSDYRSNKKAGVLVSDFTITGTQAISATDLARISGDMIGSCYDEDSDEMGERVRASFQDRGYFQAEVKSIRFKPRDPLGVPKPVALEGDVSEGPQFKLGEVTFIENHAFPAEELRQQFPLKTGALSERDKIASGLESLRRLYGTRGYLDFIAIPESQFGSNATLNLNITIQEGPQYHMGKLDIVADREVSGRLRPEWKLAEGDVWDQSYINQYLQANHDLLPLGFSKANVQTVQNCPEATIEVRLVIDPAEDKSHSEGKNIPCEQHHNVSK